MNRSDEYRGTDTLLSVCLYVCREGVRYSDALVEGEAVNLFDGALYPLIDYSRTALLLLGQRDCLEELDNTSLFCGRFDGSHRFQKHLSTSTSKVMLARQYVVIRIPYDVLKVLFYRLSSLHHGAGLNAAFRFGSHLISSQISLIRASILFLIKPVAF